jgi:hypothetical protein
VDWERVEVREVEFDERADGDFASACTGFGGRSNVCLGIAGLRAGLACFAIGAGGAWPRLA